MSKTPFSAKQRLGGDSEIILIDIHYINILRDIHVFRLTIFRLLLLRVKD